MNACVLDTDFLIGALDRGDAHHGQATRAILQMLADEVTLHMCVVNYAEALVKPADDDATLRRAVEAISALRIQLMAPDPAVGRDAARLLGLGISLADGFALATARALAATVATFDSRVRRAATQTGLGLADLY